MRWLWPVFVALCILAGVLRWRDASGDSHLPQSNSGSMRLSCTGSKVQAQQIRGGMILCN